MLPSPSDRAEPARASASEPGGDGGRALAPAGAPPPGPLRRLEVRPLVPGDAAYQLDALQRHTAGPRIISRGRLHDGMACGGFVAEVDGRPVGVALVRPEPADGSVELLFIATDIPGVGVGPALLEACVDWARGSGAGRMWLVTTNDNTRAIRFYQRQGWDLAELHHDALVASRALKPEIPLRGNDDIEMRHELVFELRLRPSTGA